jgi:2-furoyl-CoA dehydrogenase FAD binding subunit
VLHDDAGALRIGAAVRQAELARHPDLAYRYGLLALALPWVGHAQTRSRGTVCGSIAHADPSAELPLILLACGGTVHLRSRRGARDVPAARFLAGMMATARQDDELIEAVSLPLPHPDSGCAFREVARRHGDFAIVACAAVVSDSDTCLAVGGVADRPVLRALPPAGDPALDDALDDFAWDLEARDDMHATASYRRELVRRVGRTVIEEATLCRA